MRLTEFGKQFVAVVRERWPAFLDFASVNERGELTIEFPRGHSHGGLWNDPAWGDYEFASSIQFIDGTPNEEVVGCVLESGGAIGQLASLKQQPYWKDVRTVRSWLGKHDADYA